MPQITFEGWVRSWLWLLSCGLSTVLTPAVTSVSKGPYHQWPEAFTLSNEQVEVIVVPAIGRIMQIRFKGESDGPFWENRALDGTPVNSQAAEWINLGGDKTWPAPQGEWEKVTGRGWPPPQAFDSTPVEARQDGDSLVLRSAIDPHYGIRTERRIRLKLDEAEMDVETTYQKAAGAPIRVGIWIITQLQDPEKIFMPIPQKSVFAFGYNKQSEALPANLQVTNAMVTCTRSSDKSTKIGSDASDLIWAGEKWLLHIHAPRESRGDFPDQGSSAEIYTNPDPNRYVELEMLGPLQTLRQGETITRRQSYRLFRRQPGSLDTQVHSILGR